MQLSENISLKELTYSKTAEDLGIKNLPGTVELQNLTALARNVLQPVRDYFGKPVIINSGYRCLEVNRAVGSKDNSQHVKGEAADLFVKDVPLKDVFLFINERLSFDQLIYEFGRWIHVSYRTLRNRKERLIAKKRDGKTVYLTYTSINQL